MKERPTPETDKHSVDAGWIIASHSAGLFVPAEVTAGLERQRDEALEALEDIANMPEHDQDDSHRLRHKAHAAIAAVKGDCK